MMSGMSGDEATLQEAPKRRPGGRSARVGAAVLGATLETMQERGTDFSIPEIAARAGVHDATIYRRWGSKEALIVAAITAYIGEEIPIPDTGSLRGDLDALLAESVAFLASPLGTSLVRASAASAVSEMTETRRAYWSSRFARIGAIFTRAAARGEIAPDADIALAAEMLIAPLYLRLLVSHEPLTPELGQRIAEFILAAVQPRDGGCSNVQE
jgi:AcrR family transcriptional regulator